MKKKWKVMCLTQHYFNDIPTESSEKVIGFTYAISEEQACNNMRFRNGIKRAEKKYHSKFNRDSERYLYAVSI